MGATKTKLLACVLTSRPALVACGSGIALGLLACGSGLALASGAASSTTTLGGSTALSPQRVAAEFSVYLAQSAANETEPATPSQVRAYARAMHMACRRPRFGQYACSADVRTRNASQQVVTVKQWCVATVAGSGRIASGRCADPGVRVAPIDAPGYVDCARVGKTVTVRDPAGDQVVNPAQPQLPASARNHADLTEVRVAATAKEFCVDFQMSTAFDENTTLRLLVDTKVRADAGFDPSISQERTPVPELYISIPSAIAGELGFRGDSASLVIPAQDSAQPLPTGPFSFVASADYDVYAKSGGYSISDSTPAARYP